MQKEKYLLSIDQGTSATKAVLFDRQGRLVNRADVPVTQHYPQSGWVEHDPQEIFSGLVTATEKVLRKAGITSKDLLCLSISNQRETVVLWDRESGLPVMNAVVWQCQRAESLTAALESQGMSDSVREKTGLPLSPYFSAAKAAWIVKHVANAKTLMENRRLLFGTMDSYLIWRLTKGRLHATDYTNACRTQLFNIHTLTWDQDLLDIFNLHISMMPKVIDSNARYGTVDASIFGEEIPIAGVLGDSHAAFFAQCCDRGTAKVTYGTGSSVMMHVGDAPIANVKKVVSSIGYAIDGKVTYVLEGNINCTGATIKWLVEGLELIGSSKEAGEMAVTVPDTLGVYLVPAFVGLGAPHWNSNVRATLSNMSRGVKKAHVVRAAEESIAYQIADVIYAMESESKVSLQELRVDGGPTRDSFLMQFQSDILHVPVIRNQIEELSAAGAMYMGGLAMAVWHDVQEIEKLRIERGTFLPEKDDFWRQTWYSGWKAAVDKCLAPHGGTK